MKSLSLTLITSLLIALTTAIPLNGGTDSLSKRDARANLIRLADALEERDMEATATDQMDQTGPHVHGQAWP